MMQDVDTLLRYYDPLVAMYISIANTYRQHDNINRASTYSDPVFVDMIKNNRSSVVKCKMIASNSKLEIPK